MQQTNALKHKSSYAWLLGLFLSTMMLGCILLFFDMRYDTIDDTVILRQMMGFGVTEIPDFNMYVSAVLFYPLRWLSMAFPGMPWFSYLQLFLLWFASAIISKSIIQCFEHEGRSAWQGLILAFIFHVVFLLRHESRVTYTVTSAVLGAAAVSQLLSIDTKNCSTGQWIGSAMLSLLLVIFSYSLREQAVLPTLPICFAAFVAQGIRRFEAGKNWLRPLVATLLIVVLACGAVVGFRTWEISTKPGIREYMEWQNARIRIWDFLGVQSIPSETLAEYGISDGRKALMQEWYQMDGDLDAETLLALGDAVEATRDNSLSALVMRIHRGIAGLFRGDPIAFRSFLILVCMLAVFILFLCMGQRSSRKAAIWGITLGLFFSLGMTLYLAYAGRLILRAFLTISLPFAALIAGLLPQHIPQNGKCRAIIALSFIAVLVLSVLYAVPFLEEHLRKPPTEKELATEAVLAAIDDYATANEDYLLIYDGTLAIDTRMFPPTEYGISKNVHLWGGWNLHSPSYNAMLEAYGFDPDNWSLTDFLSYDVRLLRRNASAPTILLDALNEEGNVECYLETEWDGLYVMFFEEW